MIEIRRGMKIKTGQFPEIWKGYFASFSGLFCFDCP
jgi:hypothetical protein